MNWTPRGGPAQLQEEYPDLQALLCKVLLGEISSAELAQDHIYLPLLSGLGGQHALNTLMDQSGERLAYWPRVWAARTLALVGDEGCADALLQAATDPHWRVRIQAVRAAGLVANSQTVVAMATLLADEPRVRVRQALDLALRRQSSATK